MASKSPFPVFGTAAITGFDDAKTEEIFQILEKHDAKHLDTAYIYTGSEEFLGKKGAPARFTIDTKAPAFAAGCQTKQGIVDGMNESLKKLGVSSVNIYYLHGPDPKTPLEDTLAGIQELYAAGKFKKFGLSNFLPDAVQKVYDIQSAAKSVLPTVFQGNYNAVSRHIETDLFPLLRKLKIAFYAYSPIAGGFLVKTSASIRSKASGGRFDSESMVGDMYSTMYAKDTLLDALDEWEHIAKDAGVGKAELAFRWIAWHSALKREYGDGIIFGASKPEQVEGTLSAIEAGPLDAKIVQKIDHIWTKVEKDAPRDNWNSYMSSKF